MNTLKYVSCKLIVLKIANAKLSHDLTDDVPLMIGKVPQAPRAVLSSVISSGCNLEKILV